MGGLALWAWWISSVAAAPPEYALSGRAAGLADVTLARTSGETISSLDVLIHDEMNRSLVQDIPPAIWADPAALEAEAFLPRIREAVMRLAADAWLARRAAAWSPPPLRRQMMSLGAAMAVWTEHVVVPEVRVLQTDMNHYYLGHADQFLQRRQAQVRYIFKSTRNLDPQQRQALRERLLQIRSRIFAGDLGFAQAARQNSEAASAEQGGLLPPFYDGTYFRAFDQNTFNLDEPGQLSPVFEGPGGLYLIQLVRRWPARNIALHEARETIRQRLHFNHVRHYYDFQMEGLRQQSFIRNNAPWWNYLYADAPIAQVGPLRLRRWDYLLCYPDPSGPDMQAELPPIMENVDRWVEGQLALAELRRMGLLDHRWMKRARQLATLSLRSKRVARLGVPSNDYATSESALRALNHMPRATERLRLCRLIHFRLAPEPHPGTEPIGSTRRVIRAFDLHLAALRLPAAPEAIDLAEWAHGLNDPEANPTEALARLRRAAANALPQGVRLDIKPQGWVDVSIDTDWDRLLLGRGPGQISRPRWQDGTLNRYLVVDEQPLGREQILGGPLRPRILAIELGAEQIARQTRERLQREGRVIFHY